MSSSGFEIYSIVSVINSILILLIYIAGIVVCAITLKRGGGRGALLALIGFGLLALNSLCTSGVNALLLPWLQGQVHNFQYPMWMTGSSCMSTLFIGVAFVLIVLGIWNLGRARLAESTPIPEPPTFQGTDQV